MFPSPSLGPPLLSASWSPALPCGIGLAACICPAWWCAGAAGFGAAWCVAAAVPQPAARAASSARLAAGVVSLSDMAECLSGSGKWRLGALAAQPLRIWHGSHADAVREVWSVFAADFLKVR